MASDENDSENMDSDVESDVESNVSDKELQAAFASGLLKPGLHIEKSVVQKEAINNIEGLRQCLVGFKVDLPWVERLDICRPPVAPPKPMMDQLGSDPDDLSHENVHDDFKREMKFYRLAQAACLDGLARLQSMGIPTRRPDDYFAEMAKSDQHMAKVRKKLIAKQLSTERSDKAKKMRELRKYGKKVQQEVLQKRQKEKKEMLDAVKKYRKGGKGEDSRLSFLDNKSDGGKGKGQPNPYDIKQGKRREFKNKKFGFGGQKKRSKYNTKKSFQDTSDYSSKKHSNAGKSKSSKGKQVKKLRPGKARRQNKNKKR